MYQTKIEISNFRNILNTTIEFSPNINCFYGENAQGKTAILEAIYYLLKGKSFRKSVTFKEVLNVDASRALIQIAANFVEKFGEEKKRILSENFEQKILKKNDLIVKNHLDGTEIYLFNPFDTYLFFSSRAKRIDWLDELIGLADKEYIKNIKQNNKILKSKNFLITKIKQNKNIIKSGLHQLKIYNQMQAKASELVLRKRDFYLEIIEKKIKELFIELYGEKIDFKIKYYCTFGVSRSEEEICQKLDVNLNNLNESSGTHLDDIEIYLNHFLATEQASLGQQKIAFFALNLGGLEAIRDYCQGEDKKFPTMLLIDDISSELDSRKWKTLIQYLNRTNLQVFLTTANENFLNSLKLNSNATIFNVRDGFVTAFAE